MRYSGILGEILNFTSDTELKTAPGPASAGKTWVKTSKVNQAAEPGRCIINIRKTL